MGKEKFELHEVDPLADDVVFDGEDLVVEVEDDVPLQDKGRKAIAKDPLELDPDGEAKKYTKGVQKRIGELTHKAHDERRRADAAERERDEAVRVAQAALQHKRMLESQLTNGEAAFANETVEKAKLAKEAASAKYRKAFEAGDPDAQAEATAEIAAAAQLEINAKQWSQNAQNKVQTAKNALQQEKDGLNSDQQHVNTQEQRQTSDAPDKSASDWATRNPWFGSNRKMTSFVYGVHEELVFDEGIHPTEDAAKYYARIDAEMRQRFPEYDWDEDGATGDEDEEEEETPPSRKAAAKSTPAKKTAPKSVVAPVTRASTGNGNKVTLTKTQVAMAEKMGLTVEQYAREVIKLSQGA